MSAELSELLARCTVKGKVRPLLAAPEALEARHNRRLPHYRAAHITVTTAGLAPQAVADRVLEQVFMLLAGRRRKEVRAHGKS